MSWLIALTVVVWLTTTTEHYRRCEQQNDSAERSHHARPRQPCHPLESPPRSSWMSRHPTSMTMAYWSSATHTDQRDNASSDIDRSGILGGHHPDRERYANAVL